MISMEKIEWYLLSFVKGLITFSIKFFYFTSLICIFTVHTALLRKGGGDT